MKKQIVSLLLILCFVLSAFVLASCDKNGKKTDTTEPATEPVASDTQDATTATTADKWEKLAPKVTMMTESSRQLKIEYSMKKNAEKASKNEIYLQGPDEVVDGVTPGIQEMIYKRNKAAEDLLGIKITYQTSDYEYGKQAGHIDLVVKGNAADAPDLFVNMLYDLNIELMQGSFKDVKSIPNSFFDFDTDGWLKEWMENLSFTGDRAYILGSDYFLDVFRAVSLLPFNMNLMNENAVKLAPAILEEGDELGTGEELTARFFDLVDSRKWTWDVLGKLCEAIWEDRDNDSSDSINDRLGIIADRFGGVNAASFLYSCGLEITKVSTIEDESSEYNHKQWLTFPADSEAAGLNLIFGKVKAVFEGSGSLATSATFSGNTPETPGSAYHHTKFGQDELLFAGACTLGTLEDDAFQNMESLYSVVPFPLIASSEGYDYNTIIINQGDAGAINVHVKPPKAKALTAFIQYCTEKSPAIREQFLQIVMKYKVTTYNQGTDRMLNIIYEGIRFDRDKTVDDLICANNRGNRWHSLLKDNEFEGGASYITTQYESLLSQKQAALDEALRTWYTLPITE